MFDALGLLKELDYSRYLACLYLPDSVRHKAATLYAFDAEIRRIPHVVSEPMPGEIRIQWWLDLIKSGANVGAGPLADATITLIQDENLPAEIFHTYLKARIFDLYQDPMPNLASLEGYLGETVSVFFLMNALVMGQERSAELSDACGHSGVALGTAELLQKLSYHRHAQQSYLPLDVLAKCGLTRECWLFDQIDERHIAVIDQLITLAQDHHNKARSAIAGLSKDVHSVFLPLGFVPKLLSSASKQGEAIFTKATVPGRLALQVELFKANLRGFRS